MICRNGKWEKAIKPMSTEMTERIITILDNHKESIIEFTQDENHNLELAKSLDLTTNLNDICINLSDPTFNGQYEPYISREQSLAVINDAFPQGMHGIGSAQDEIRYNKTTQKWEKVQRIGSVKMKELNWLTSSQSSFVSSFWATVSNKAIGQNVLSNKYATDKSWVGGWPNTTRLDKAINGIREDSPSAQTFANKVWLRDTAFTSASELIASFTDNDILYYELAEPIVTELDFEGNLDYEVWNGGNEIAQTEELSTPVTTSAIYGFNAYAKIKENEGRITEHDDKITELEGRKPDWLASDDIRNRTHFIDDAMDNASLEARSYSKSLANIANNIEGIEYYDDGINVKRIKYRDTFFAYFNWVAILKDWSAYSYDILDYTCSSDAITLDNGDIIRFDFEFTEFEDYVILELPYGYEEEMAKDIIPYIANNYYIIDTPSIVKLNPKYIPSSIARQSEIERLEEKIGGSSEKLDFCIGTFFPEDTEAFFALCRENYDKENHTLTHKYHGAIMLGDLEPRGFIGQFYCTTYGLSGDAEVFQCYGCGTLFEDGVPQEQAVTVVILRQSGTWSIYTVSEMNAQGVNLANMTM